MTDRQMPAMKHRNGSIGEISLMFQPNTNAFLPMAVRKDYSES